MVPVLNSIEDHCSPQSSDTRRPCRKALKIVGSNDRSCARQHVDNSWTKPLILNINTTIAEFLNIARGRPPIIMQFERDLAA